MFRPVEGRLSLDLPHAPFAPEGEASPAHPIRLALAAADVARITSDEPSLENLRLLAAVQLLERRAPAAIATLERAAATAPQDAPLLSDLGAAYLERARSSDDPHDLILALEAVERALFTDRSLLQARFNRGLILQRLHLLTATREAWRAYEVFDPASPWTADAQARAATLDVPPEDTLWQEERHRMEAAATASRHEGARDIAGRFPHLARLHAQETLLPEWAEAAANRRHAEATWRLRLVYEIGELLLQQQADGLVLESARAVVGAIADSRRLGLLIRGHRAYRNGLGLFRQERYPEAAIQFTEAWRALADAESPFANWVLFDRARCAYYSGDPRLSAQLLAEVDQTAAPRGWHNLRAQALRCLALLHYVDGNLGDALRLGSEAEPLLSATGDRLWLAHVRVLRGAALERLGDRQGAWRARWASLAVTKPPEMRVQRENALLDAIRALRAEGRHLSAMVLHDELVPLGLASTSAQSRAIVLLDRARTLHLLGLTEAAAADLSGARRHTDTLPASGVRDRMLAEIDLTMGAALAQSRPREARRLLDLAGKTLERLGLREELVAIHVAMADAWAAEGDDRHARAHLERAEVEVERDRARLADDRLRVSHQDSVRRLFDRLIDFEVRRGSFERALDWAERARARSVLAALAFRDTRSRSSGEEGQPLAAAEIAANLPPHTAVVEYAVLPDRLIAWVIRPGTVSMVETPVSAQWLEREVRTVRTALESVATEDTVATSAARLFDVLLMPIEGRLAPSDRLVVVPDRMLHELPFGVLRNRLTGRDVVEDRALTVAPSASVFVRLTEDREHRTNAGSALIVGASGAVLPAGGSVGLPGADGEARQIARLYPDATLLVGASATRTGVLAALRGREVFHFAGHAVANSTEPGLSYLALAEPAHAGRFDALFARDLPARALSDTRLVVLSACRSAAAAVSDSEGPLGLARYFLAAGVPTVVGSLWDADDRQTAALMGVFHEQLRRGADPANALRTAQLQLRSRSDRASRSPAHWSAFIVLGTGASGPSNPREEGA